MEGEEEEDEEAVTMGEVEEGEDFLREKLEEGELKKDRHRTGGARARALRADLK